jgi:hypothetical protein
MTTATAARLHVHSPFPGYAKGDVVTDPAAVAAILGTEFEARVSKVRADTWHFHGEHGTVKAAREAAAKAEAERALPQAAPEHAKPAPAPVKEG